MFTITPKNLGTCAYRQQLAIYISFIPRHSTGQARRRRDGTGSGRAGAQPANKGREGEDGRGEKGNCLPGATLQPRLDDAVMVQGRAGRGPSWAGLRVPWIELIEL